MDRIAFVNAVGALFTIDPDGGEIRQLTGGFQATAVQSGAVLASSLDFENYYAWPTWSPNGTKIAISRVDVTGGGSKVSIEVIDTATTLVSTLYNDPTGGIVAQGAPHYLYWSPDSRYLAFLAATQTGLTLFIGDLETGEEPVAVATGAPLYLHWSADSNSLLIHTGIDVMLAQNPFSSVVRTLLTTTAGFRVPALAPGGERLVYIKSNSAGTGLYLAPVVAPTDGEKLLDVGELSAFAWSPDGMELAVADQKDERSAIYQRLIVVSVDGKQVRTIGEGTILAFFWSPQGDKIAWVELDAESRTLQWLVAERSGEGVKELFKFQPSVDVFTMLSFFDQYAYSHSPWSPDGTKLVVAGTMQRTPGRLNGQTPTTDRVFVLEVTGATLPKDIAAGTLAVWSWN